MEYAVFRLAVEYLPHTGYGAIVERGSRIRRKKAVMASSQGYLDYVLDLLSGVEGLTTRKMMGEYLLYSEGTLFGGVYDDRLLIKETPASASALGATAVPYEGARPMRLVDSDDGDALSRLVGAVCAELRGGPARRACR